MYKVNLHQFQEVKTSTMYMIFGMTEFYDSFKDKVLQNKTK